MPIKIRRLQFEPIELPGEIRMVISDAETPTESKVWISARFPLERPSSDRLPLIVLKAVDELQKLIDEGKEDASQPPPSPNS